MKKLLKKMVLLFAAAAFTVWGNGVSAYAAAPGVESPQYSHHATLSPSIYVEDGIAYCGAWVSSREMSSVVSVTVSWKCNMNTYAGELYMVAMFADCTGTEMPFLAAKQIAVPSEGYMYELVVTATVTFNDGEVVVLNGSDVDYY